MCGDEAMNKPNGEVWKKWRVQAVRKTDASESRERWFQNSVLYCWRWLKCKCLSKTASNSKKGTINEYVNWWINEQKWLITVTWTACTWWGSAVMRWMRVKLNTCREMRMKVKAQRACDGINRWLRHRERRRKWREASAKNVRIGEIGEYDKTASSVSLHYATLFDKLTSVQDLNNQVLSSPLLTIFRLSPTIDVTG